MNLNGKNVAFVGSFGGIGFESCKSFLRKGVANLAVLDVKNNPTLVKELEKISPKSKVIFIPIDLTNKQSIENAIKTLFNTLKHVDVLVNGSGVVRDDNIQLTIDVNLLGLINTTLAAIPYMDKSNGGKGGLIVNIASVLGLEPCPPIAVYSATKFGVIGFTRSLSDEHYYKRTGIGYIMICPGFTETPLIEVLDGKTTFPYSKELMDHIMTGKKQTAEQCGVNLVKAVESNKNGSIWICDLGTLREVKPVTYWVHEH